MIELKTDELREGMILAHDVIGTQTRILAEADTVLSEETIALIRAQAAGPVAICEDISLAETFAAINSRVDGKFAPFSSQPVMIAIAAAAKRYLKERAGALRRR
jgi:hypothetical protein